MDGAEAVVSPDAGPPPLPEPETGVHDEPLLLQINIHGDFIQSSTRVKLTPTLTAGVVCNMVAEKNGVTAADAVFYTLIAVYTTTTRPKPFNTRPLHLIRTLKRNDAILNVIKEKEAKTPPTKEEMYTTKW